MNDEVMVIDDDADIRDTLSMLLERHGFRVITAANGKDALRWLHGGARPALILLDLMMPEVSGEEFRRLQLADGALATIPVVVLSGVGRIDLVAQSIGVDVLPKPIELTKLVETVKRFCSPARGGTPSSPPRADRAY
jgi:DNA-binding NtrC family response regulator